MIQSVKITRSPLKTKKFRVQVTEDGKTVAVDFGAKGYQDYTQHKDPERRMRYLARHSAREDWTKEGRHTPGFWSRWLLWEKPSLREALRNVRAMLLNEKKKQKKRISR